MKKLSDCWKKFLRVLSYRLPLPLYRLYVKKVIAASLILLFPPFVSILLRAPKIPLFSLFSLLLFYDALLLKIRCIRDEFEVSTLICISVSSRLRSRIATVVFKDGLDSQVTYSFKVNSTLSSEFTENTLYDLYYLKKDPRNLVAFEEK